MGILTARLPPACEVGTSGQRDYLNYLADTVVCLYAYLIFSHILIMEVALTEQGPCTCFLDLSNEEPNRTAAKLLSD